MSPRLVDAEPERDAPAERARSRAPAPAESAGARVDGRGAALGFLALVPLVAIYELGVRASGGTSHNLAELVVSLPLVPFGEHVALARALLVVVVAAACAWSCFHAELGLAPRLFRIALEGLAGAALLAPALLSVLAFAGGLDALRDVRLPAAPDAPGLAQLAVVAGGAAYEELVFRMGLQGLFYLALSRTIVFFVPFERGARWTAELVAVLLSALVFAAAHLAVFTQVFGPGGEPWHAGIFPWRVLAGILLAVLFRWRGPGVAAWTHAFFNVALAIGAGPEVFL